MVPTAGGLVKGQAYYARVFAYSPVGFSQGQVAPYPAKPTTVPGRPTSVSLEVYDAQSLKVVFSPPADDGGDTGGHFFIQSVFGIPKILFRISILAHCFWLSNEDVSAQIHSVDEWYSEEQPLL